jgi:hypothetical protein
MASAKIIGLRKVLEERFPREPLRSATLLPTGVCAFDEVLGGGLLRGAITQLVSQLPSSGTALMLHQIIIGLQTASQFVALVDGKNGFDPFGETNRLLWVRCQNITQALKATDLLLRDGNLPLTILDLKQNLDLGKISGSIWYRLQRLAEESRTSLLVFCSRGIVANAYATIHLKSGLRFAELSSSFTQITTNLQLQCRIRRLGMEKQYVCA